MTASNPQAAELNANIASANPHIANMLSARGHEIFFPKKGILGQTAEAKGKRINATIGEAREDDGSPLHLPCVAERIQLSPADVFPYAPSFGVPALRSLWQETIRKKNPSLGDAAISNPVVTNALTHALSICGYLFADAGDEIITPDLFWGNYGLIFKNAYGAALKTFPTFDGDGYNVEGLRTALAEGAPGKRIVLLNFPNNPTGYTPTETEAEQIVEVIVEAAAENPVVALVDDAYFGLVYEDGIVTESMFADLAQADERLLAVKIDGATKEDYVWGLRVGFITYGVKNGTEPLYDALASKTAGAVRGNISNASHLSQSLLLQAYQSPDYEVQKAEKYNTLKRRCVKVKEILETHPEYADSYTALPFNSGYFMCLKLKTADPETVRKILLDEFSTGIIVAAGVVRVAFSSAPYDLLEELYANIHAACLKSIENN